MRGTTPLAAATLQRKIACLRSFYRHLQRRGMIKHNPASELSAPRLATHRPQSLSRQDIQQLLAQPRGTSAAALRGGYRPGSAVQAVNASHKGPSVNARAQRSARSMTATAKGDRERLQYMLAAYLPQQCHHVVPPGTQPGERDLKQLPSGVGREQAPHLTGDLWKRKAHGQKAAHDSADAGPSDGIHRVSRLGEHFQRSKVRKSPCAAGAKGETKSRLGKAAAEAGGIVPVEVVGAARREAYAQPRMVEPALCVRWLRERYLQPGAVSADSPGVGDERPLRRRIGGEHESAVDPRRMPAGSEGER